MKSDWMAEASCAGLPSDYFILEDDDGRGKGNYRRNTKIEYGKRVCASCPVQIECIEDQMAWEEKNVPIGQKRVTLRGILPHEREQYAAESNGRYTVKRSYE